MSGSIPSREAEWSRPLLLGVGGLLLFETVTGLAIWLLPFSVPNQLAVLLHTLAGLALLVPFAWYQLRHWRRYRRMRMSHVVLTGYFSMAATAVALVSGSVLTWQAAFGNRISYAWDVAHIVATLALVAAVLPHVLTLVFRARRAPAFAALRVRALQRRFAVGVLSVAGGLGAVLALAAATQRPVEPEGAFPDDYGYLYGEDRPFAPSLATTSTGGPLRAAVLAGSDRCGTAGCHREIAEEWRVSAHRWAAMDPGFQKVQEVMAEQNGPETTRYCAGCHDPISLFSGTKNVFSEDLTNQEGYREGVSCIVCHAIRETDVQGNADYVLQPPERYLFELREGPTAGLLSDFLIRAYPRHHVRSLQHTLFKSPEFCAACHKQFIDEEINQVGWVQLQNQYDNWRKSRWNHPGEPEKTIECRECHMPLTASEDPGAGDDLDYNRAGDDGKHRSHRFLAANQVVPLLLDLDGAEEQVALTERWLRGELPVPEIAHKWREGAAVPVALVVPERATAGEEVRIQVEITNHKVGHDFPTGPLDIIQAWLELEVTDQEENPVFVSGRRDARNFIQEGSFIFKAEPVDRYGNLIDRHNLWEMVGVRYRRAVFPGFSDRAEFAFLCPALLSGERPRADDPAAEAVVGAAGASEDPATANGHRTRSQERGGEPRGLEGEGWTVRAPADRVTELRVSVRLLYRKFDQFLLDFLFGEHSGLTARVTVLSEDEAVIPVLPSPPRIEDGAVTGGPPPDPGVPDS